MFDCSDISTIISDISSHHKGMPCRSLHWSSSGLFSCGFIRWKVYYSLEAYYSFTIVRYIWTNSEGPFIEPLRYVRVITLICGEWSLLRPDYAKLHLLCQKGRTVEILNTNVKGKKLRLSFLVTDCYSFNAVPQHIHELVSRGQVPVKGQFPCWIVTDEKHNSEDWEPLGRWFKDQAICLFLSEMVGNMPSSLPDVCFRSGYTFCL